MDYEQKYKEALELARDYYKANSKLNKADENVILEDIFPELSESEDEKIRKDVKRAISVALDYSYFDKETANNCITWLEKQGSEPNWCHHKVDLSNCSEEYRKAYYDGWNNCNQQYSQCKSEGNDVVKCLINGMKFYYEDNEEATWGTEKFSMKVKDILSWLEKQGEREPILDFKAKDWYVSKVDGKIHNIYHSVDKTEPKFKVGDVLCDKSCTTLNKESQPNFEITDIRNGMYICDKCSFPISQQDEYELVAKRIEQKSAWSEEDEKMLNTIIADVSRTLHSCGIGTDEHTIRIKAINFLKYLKQQKQWKPSDEQMRALHDMNLTGNISYAGQGQTLIELYNDLKKLKQ